MCDAFFQAGDILLAADLKNESATGHITDFPGSVDTVIAQLPVLGNVVPGHVLLHGGRCGKGDMRGGLK